MLGLLYYILGPLYCILGPLYCILGPLYCAAVERFGGLVPIPSDYYIYDTEGTACTHSS